MQSQIGIDSGVDVESETGIMVMRFCFGLVSENILCFGGEISVVVFQGTTDALKKALGVRATWEQNQEKRGAQSIAHDYNSKPQRAESKGHRVFLLKPESFVPSKLLMLPKSVSEITPNL